MSEATNTQILAAVQAVSSDLANFKHEVRTAQSQANQRYARMADAYLAVRDAVDVQTDRTCEEFANVRDEMNAGFAGVREEFGNVRGEVAQLREDTAAGFAGVRQEFANLREEIADVRGQVADVRGGVAQLREDTAAGFTWVREEFANVRQETNAGFGQVLKEMREGFAGIKIDLADLENRSVDTVKALCLHMDEPHPPAHTKSSAGASARKKAA